jgi:hypothetical protein
MTSEPRKSDDDDLEKHLTLLRDNIERNLDRGSETATQIDKTVISLSAGALLLSITFVPTFAPKKLWLWLLFLAWISFTIAMVLVIFAMRSAQRAIEKGIGDSATGLRILEGDPAIARQFLVEQRRKQIEKPLTVRRITRHEHIYRLNLGALIAFIIGVLCLATFTGYNLWQTPPPEQIQSQHVIQPRTTTTTASPTAGGNRDRR